MSDKGIPTTKGDEIARAASIERCNKLIAEHADEPLLRTAYMAKRDKEVSANNDLFLDAAIAKSEEQM